MLKTYLARLHEIATRGDAREGKGRSLELDDIRHYCRVVTAISRTIEIQRENGSVYGEIENSVIEFRNGGCCV